MHSRIYRNAASATGYANKIKTSQIAFAEGVCSLVYASSGYGQSVSNFAQISFATDNVFSDGVTLQEAALAGSVASGYLAPR